MTLSNGKNLFKGKRINSFTEAEEDIDGHTLNDIIPFILNAELIKQGAIFSKITPFDSFVVYDGNLITGQDPASARNVAKEMIRIIAR